MNIKNITTKIGFVVVGAGAVAMITAGTASADLTRVDANGDFNGQGTVFVPQTSKQAMEVVSAEAGAPLLTGGAKLSETKHSIVEMTIRDTNVKPAGAQYAPAVRSYEAIRSGEERINSKSPESVPAGVAIGLGFKDDPLAPAE